MTAPETVSSPSTPTRSVLARSHGSAHPPLTKDALESGLWHYMESAPKDGTWVLLWLRHPYYDYAAQSGMEDEYEAVVDAKWIDHNGGGWTWNGMFGRPVAWCHIEPNTEVCHGLSRPKQ